MYIKYFNQIRIHLGTKPFRLVKTTSVYRLTINHTKCNNFQAKISILCA